MTAVLSNRILGLLGLFLFCTGALQGAEIPPPFKLSWGEAPAEIERIIQKAKVKIVGRRPTRDGGEAWDVEGIVQDGLKRTIFYFRAGALVGVELQYSSERWPQEKYDDFMGRWRRTLEQSYGQGQLIARKTEPVGELSQTIVGYNWNLNNTAVNLVFFSAQNAGNVFRTLSIHYKTN
jgi:hypothetical protein